MSGTEPLIAVIEDETPIRRFLRASLTVEGFRVVEATTAQEGLRIITQQLPALALLEDIDEGTVDFLEFVMAHYYLGDKEGRGLASVLDDLRQQQDVAFGQLFLAGLGWALRNDRTAAHSNFRLAVMRSKSTASGRLLPHFWWAFCADLLPASEHDDYARYFADATSTRAEKTIQEK